MGKVIADQSVSLDGLGAALAQARDADGTTHLTFRLAR
jgi:hypothetical protein